MQTIAVGDIELEYETSGSGEPILLVDMVLADGFLPLVAEPALANRFQLIRYHKRGWVGSTHTPPPVAIADHASDAAGLLDALGVRRAHVAGHSSGAAVAAQLALDHPDRVHTLTLLEPPLLALPRGQRLLQRAEPALQAYMRGDHPEAVATFVSVVCGLEWPVCRRLLDERTPGAVERAIADADTFFGIELPALLDWTLEAEQAARIDRPVLSVVGARTDPFWVDVDSFLRSALSNVEHVTIAVVGHLLHLQRPEPVARATADFLARHPLRATAVEAGAPS